jgi:hypothetical protein
MALRPQPDSQLLHRRLALAAVLLRRPYLPHRRLALAAVLQQRLCLLHRRLALAAVLLRRSCLLHRRLAPAAVLLRRLYRLRRQLALAAVLLDRQLALAAVLLQRSYRPHRRLAHLMAGRQPLGRRHSVEQSRWIRPDVTRLRRERAPLPTVQHLHHHRRHRVLPHRLRRRERGFPPAWKR